MRQFMLCVGAALWSGAAQAHPHVFVDAGIEVLVNDAGFATAVRISWNYDDLFSLLIVGERGLDTDGDGVLTSDETAALQGFDMQWDAGYAGDTFVLADGKPISLSGPSDWTAAYTDGRLKSSHLRALAAPIDLRKTELTVQVYDPSYYTSYTIASDPVITGGPAGCNAQVFLPDQAAADAALEAALQEFTDAQAQVGDFPAVGAAYAEEARFTCANAS